MASTMTALQTITVTSGGAATVVFNSIPQTYTDLVIKMSARTAYAGIYDIMNVQINGSSTVLATKQVYGTGTAVASDETVVANGYAWMGYPQANSATANVFSNQEITIPNYASSNYKSISYDAVDENNATASMMYFGAALWSSTKPITSIAFGSANAANWLQYSTFTLYGVYNSASEATPSVPTIGTATDAGTGTEAYVAFTPGANAGAVYTALSSPGSITGSNNYSPILVSGLTSGTAYTFTVKAANPATESAYSSASNSVTPVVPAGYYPIGTYTVTSGGASSLVFSSIPQTYKHLQIRGTDQQNYGSNDSGYTGIQLNSTNTAKWNRHQMWGTGSSVAAYGLGASNNNWGTVGASGLVGTRTQYFAANIIDIYDYTSTAKYKTVKAFGGLDLAGASGSNIGIYTSTWQDTAAVSSITMNGSNGPFKVGSTYTLYGILG